MGNISISELKNIDLFEGQREPYKFRLVTFRTREECKKMDPPKYPYLMAFIRCFIPEFFWHKGDNLGGNIGGLYWFWGKLVWYGKMQYYFQIILFDYRGGNGEIIRCHMHLGPLYFGITIRYKLRKDRI